jgi:hypothetical protein
MSKRVRSLGVKQQLPKTKLPGTDIEITPGEHLWVVAGAWRVNPATFNTNQEMILDMENFLLLSNPGCYVCEQEWNFVTASKPCPGEPR